MKTYKYTTNGGKEIEFSIEDCGVEDFEEIRLERTGHTAKLPIELWVKDIELVNKDDAALKIKIRNWLNHSQDEKSQEIMKEILEDDRESKLESYYDV